MRIYNHSEEKSGTAMPLPLPAEGPAAIGKGPLVQLATYVEKRKL